MKRRLVISLKAHYAQSFEELLELLEPENINYFVFSKQRFYPEALANEKYFSPLDTLVKELTSRPIESYVYKQIPKELNGDDDSFQVFRDDQSVVIDLKKLAANLEAIKQKKAL